MPKVSDEHLDRRRRQILDVAMALFARQGFRRTSMREIVAASGMSAGAVYHYFPTKDDLIAATGAAVAEAYRAPVATLLADGRLPDPATLLRALTDAMARIHDGPVDFTRIGIFMWAEALADAGAMARLCEVQEGLRAVLVGLVRRWQDGGVVADAAAPEEVAAALYGLVPGFTLQLNTLGEPDAAGYARGAAALGPALATPS